MMDDQTELDEAVRAHDMCMDALREAYDYTEMADSRDVYAMRLRANITKALEAAHQPLYKEE